MLEILGESNAQNLANAARAVAKFENPLRVNVLVSELLRPGPGTDSEAMVTILESLEEVVEWYRDLPRVPMVGHRDLVLGLFNDEVATGVGPLPEQGEEALDDVGAGVVPAEEVPRSVGRVPDRGDRRARPRARRLHGQRDPARFSVVSLLLLEMSPR